MPDFKELIRTGEADAWMKKYKYLMDNLTADDARAVLANCSATFLACRGDYVTNHVISQMQTHADLPGLMDLSVKHERETRETSP